jgi:hypothetical protein
MASIDSTTASSSSPHTVEFPSLGAKGLNVLQWKNEGEHSSEDNFWIVVDIPEKYRPKDDPSFSTFGYFTSCMARSLIMCYPEIVQDSSIVKFAIPWDKFAVELERIIKICDRNPNWYGSYINTIPVTRVLGHSSNCR